MRILPPSYLVFAAVPLILSLFLLFCDFLYQYQAVRVFSSFILALIIEKGLSFFQHFCLARHEIFGCEVVFLVFEEGLVAGISWFFKILVMELDIVVWVA